MFVIRFAITAKKCASVSFLLFLCLIVISVYVLSPYRHYRVDHHWWLFTHNILDLPEKDVQYFNTRRWDYDGWTPGNPKWLEDPTEFHSKLPKNVSYTGTHEILYYNKRPVQRIQQENELLRACPVRNCHITDDMSKYDTSSAVIFELSHHDMSFPSRTRPIGQIWIFNDFEPAVINGRWQHRHRIWDGKMNWSMSYRCNVHRPTAKRYTFETCGKKFATRVGLSAHLRRVHAECPFVCHSCNKSFATKQDLQYHEDAHGGAKRHICLSGKAYLCRSGLAKHNRLLSIIVSVRTRRTLPVIRVFSDENSLVDIWMSLFTSERCPIQKQKKSLTQRHNLCRNFHLYFNGTAPRCKLRDPNIKERIFFREDSD